MYGAPEEYALKVPSQRHAGAFVRKTIIRQRRAALEKAHASHQSEALVHGDRYREIQLPILVFSGNIRIHRRVRRGVWRYGARADKSSDPGTTRFERDRRDITVGYTERSGALAIRIGFQFCPVVGKGKGFKKGELGGDLLCDPDAVVALEAGLQIVDRQFTTVTEDPVPQLGSEVKADGRRQKLGDVEAGAAGPIIPGMTKCHHVDDSIGGSFEY